MYMTINYILHILMYTIMHVTHTIPNVMVKHNIIVDNYIIVHVIDTNTIIHVTDEHTTGSIIDMQTIVYVIDTHNIILCR